jgi:hypothetical protein
MGWRDLLENPNAETMVSPWVGGRSLRSRTRTWRIDRPPREHGWYEFELSGRTAKVKGPTEPHVMQLDFNLVGYLVGDRFVRKASFVDPDPSKITEQSERIHLVEEGLDRFALVSAGRMFENGPLIYREQEFPDGAEDDVMSAFLDQKDSVVNVKGVTPALDAAFRMETWQREQAEKRRQELERIRREEEERRAREERRQALTEKLGDGAGRREMAAVDFTEAARAALAVGGATLLDIRDSRRGEKAVRYRLDGRRYECICDEKTLRIIDAGICLIDHHSDEKGDTYFTLESLPAVVRQADREGVLVVFRHV